VEAQRGEIVSATYAPSENSLTLNVGDSTSLATTARIVVKGLPAGQYTISYGNRKERRSATGLLILEWPLKASGRVAITKVP